MRLWKTINGVPYMVNDPRLGILALNPKKRRKKNMARKYGARHMAWVRSFKKNPKRHKKARRHNPPGPIAAAMYNPRRHKKSYRKHNPPGTAMLKARGFLGMPPMMPIVYGASGFVATAFINKTVFSFLPTTMTTDPATGQVSPLVKYATLIGSVVLTSFAAKSFLGPGAAAFAGVGGGIYVISQAAHDFAPNVVPGMGELDLGSYANIKAYRQVRGLKAVQPVRGGALNIGAPAWGSQNTTDTAEWGGTEVVASRFRRFQ